MITDWLLNLLGSAVDKFYALLDSMIPPVPDWMSGLVANIQTVVGYAGGLGAWVPMQLAAVVVVFIPIALGVGLGIKVARIAASYATLGGGSAG